MSGEYVARLKKRAENFIREAKEAFDPNLAMFFVEQSLQLYVKAVYYELFGEKIRGHSIRSLLSFLYRSLEDNGFKEVSEKVRSFTDMFREELILAEEAYIESRYGEISYSDKDVHRLLRVAEQLFNFLREVENAVKLG
mgnify:CR=1 FL=1